MGKFPFWLYAAALVLLFGLCELFVMFLQALLVLPSTNGAPGW
ncbi:hypothetical protein C8E87_0206 [Paractinoplanes brasiliensis]|uniref:Uncharacterized protein n=2 Tax=Paractinoplanes brasiliensis TaxID=52695 RepID=A0A4R6JLG3_9ACTN|nr:hypothetical protein C8E87_0206 [Actinoplanes brasiliensis]